MKEGISQLFFWGSISCLPFSIVLFVKGFNSKETKKSFFLIFIGSIPLSHFLWYFAMLGGTLAATKDGQFHSKPWLHYYPIALGVTLLAAICRYVASGAQENQP